MDDSTSTLDEQRKQSVKEEDNAPVKAPEQPAVQPDGPKSETPDGTLDETQAQTQTQTIVEPAAKKPEKVKKPFHIHVPKFVFIILAAAVVVGAAGACAFQMFSTREIKGIDISNYQGNVSWRAISENGSARFTYIKATEGMTYQDPYFKKNWEGAAKQGITAGAYHFFTLTSTGSEQAENFISMVPKQKGKLPPAIDVEAKIVNESQLKSELNDYISAVMKYYGQKPVFYVSSKVYNILYDMYPGYDFWVINYDGRPAAKGWTFWQYSENGKLPGIDGKIDLDIYRGSLWKFNSMLSK